MRRNISLLLILLFLNLIFGNELHAQQIVTAQVTAVTGSRITIDQGSLQGLKPGSEGVIYYMQSVAERTVRLEVAMARVVSANNDSAQLVVFDSSAPVEQGYLVEFRVTIGAPGPIQAKTEKKGGSKWWIWLIVAAAGGGLAAALGGGGGGSGTPPPTTATISIDLPAN